MKSSADADERLVERVAEAIYNAGGCHALWPDVIHSRREPYRRRARAAIAAMEEWEG